MDNLLVYDVGELGWSLPLAAHVNFLSKTTDRNITVCTTKDKFVLYYPLGIKIIELPKKIASYISGLDKDGTHLFDLNDNKRITNDVLCDVFKKQFPDFEIYDKHGEFFGERIFFKPVPTRKINKFINRYCKSNSIIVFLRNRVNKFAQRNLGKEFYVNLINNLCKIYSNYDIITIGRNSETIDIEDCVKYDNYIDISVLKDDIKIDLLIAMLNSGKVRATIGPQSSLPKISLLCGIPSFMIGHERVRHTIFDNWFNTKSGFFNAWPSENGYQFNHLDCVEAALKFCCLNSEQCFYRDGDEFKKYVLYFDVGEVGWSQFLAAHIIRKSEEENERAMISTSKAKQVFYRNCTYKFIDVPKVIKDIIHNAEPENEHVVKNNSIAITGLELSYMYEDLFPTADIFLDYMEVRTNLNKYFKPYSHSIEAANIVNKLYEVGKTIIVFPRARTGVFGNRNLDEYFYNSLVESLLNNFDNSITVLGARNSSYNLSKTFGDKIIDMVNYDDCMTLDILVALCNLKKALFTVGSQSGPPKISLLCGVPSFIIGHEIERHTLYHNWAKTKVGFHKLAKVRTKRDKYFFEEGEMKSCIDAIIEFGRSINENILQLMRMRACEQWGEPDNNSNGFGDEEVRL